MRSFGRHVSPCSDARFASRLRDAPAPGLAQNADVGRVPQRLPRLTGVHPLGGEGVGNLGGGTVLPPRVAGHAVRDEESVL
jgi:hypothetical protein